MKFCQSNVHALAAIYRERPRVRLVICLFSAIVGLATVRPCAAQLDLLSAGDTAGAWRKAQIAVLEEQLSDVSLGDPLRKELQAQVRWLAAWRPGSLSAQPMWKPPASVKTPIPEPVVDPNGLAANLRARLLGPNAKPSARDTQELQGLLAENPKDIGLRQLHLHWLDQIQYRKTYPDEIADAAVALHALLVQMQQTNDVLIARQYCLYRRARALAYRELPDVVKEKPIQDPRQLESHLIGAYRELVELAGEGRTEFILIDIRMLRRDLFYGRALVQLTDHAAAIDRKWFLKKRRDLLRELGWELAAKEAADIYANLYPEAVAQEIAESDTAASDAE